MPPSFFSPRVITMSLSRRALAAVVLLVTATLAPAAAPPVALPIGHWIEQLESEDEATWRAAAENLWKAGTSAEPALRKAARSTDPDVVLRARTVLSKLEWGIRPETPAAVVKLIEGYRAGTQEQKRAAVDDLLRRGAPGFVAARAVLAREDDREARQAIVERLKTRGRPAARAAIVRGDLAAAEKILDASARPADPAAVRDLVVFLTLLDRAEQTAESLEERRESPRLAAYLYRAIGDRERAARLAEKSGDKALLGGILEEQEDFKQLVKLDLPGFRPAQPKASLLWRAGDRKGFESVLDSVSEVGPRTAICLYNGRPRDGIRGFIELGLPASACQMMVDQGRIREALALPVPDAEKNPVGAITLMLEQAIAAESIGDPALRKKLTSAAFDLIKGQMPKQPGYVITYLRAGNVGGWLDEAVRDAGKLLDEHRDAKLTAAMWRPLLPEDGEHAGAWWEYFGTQKDAPAPSVTLRRVVDWFVLGKADKDFDRTFDPARKDEGLKKLRGARWLAALVRVCVKVGKFDLLEKILKEAAEGGSAFGSEQYGNFLFTRGRYAEAATAYQKGLKLSPGIIILTYLRGLALIRADELKEGHALVERARLLPLGDDNTRSQLAAALDRLRLVTDANNERLLLSRTAEFRSPVLINSLNPLAIQAGRMANHSDAARYCRRQFTAAAFYAGMGFTDARVYVRLPGSAHLHQARALVAAGKLDEALEQERQVRLYQPEEPGVASELVCALQDAGRKRDADRLFALRYALFQRACVEYPKHAERHHRLAWFTSRTKRQMDRGLLHAKLSVALKPDSDRCLSTLSELHFQRGEKEEALAAIKKAAKLGKDKVLYAALVKRIESGDTKAPIPSR